MMRALRALVVAMVLCGAAGLMAAVPVTLRYDYHSEPVEWLPSEVLCDTLPQNYGGIMAHLRVAVPPARRMDVALCYDIYDDANYRQARMMCRPPISADGIVANPVDVELSECVGGVSTVTYSTRIYKDLTAASCEYSIILRSSEAGTVLEIGQNEVAWSYPVGYDAVPGSKIECRTATPVALRKYSVEYVESTPVVPSRFADQYQLNAYLAASTDPSEGYWTYLDSDVKPLQASIGGDYSLATVKSLITPGAYDIIYLSGAVSHGPLWQPLSIKGYLLPTPFRDHYDLRWHCANGHLLSKEMSADIQLDANILKLNLPLFRSELRFRRCTRP